MKTKQNRHRGGNFDDFLKEQDIYEDVCAGAAKRVISSQIAQALTAQQKTVAELAREMKTSRAAIHRILDDKNYSLSLRTLSRTAAALGKRIKLELVEA